MKRTPRPTTHASLDWSFLNKIRKLEVLDPITEPDHVEKAVLREFANSYSEEIDNISKLLDQLSNLMLLNFLLIKIRQIDECWNWSLWVVSVLSKMMDLVGNHC